MAFGDMGEKVGGEGRGLVGFSSDRDIIFKISIINQLLHVDSIYPFEVVMKLQLFW